MDDRSVAKFEKLETLFKRDLITAEEYGKRKEALLDEIVSLAQESESSSSLNHASQPQSPASGSNDGTTQMAGIVVPRNTEGANFLTTKLNEFYSENIPDGACPRFLIDPSQPLHLSKWLLSTKMLTVSVWLAVAETVEYESPHAAFVAQHRRLEQIKEITTRITSAKSRTGDLVEVIEVKKKHALNIFNIPVLWVQVVRSPVPEEHQGWAVVLFSNRGWMSHEAISIIAKEFGYTVAFQ